MNEEYKELTKHLIEIKSQVIKVADELEKTVEMSKKNEEKIQEIQEKYNARRQIIETIIDNLLWIVIAIGIIIDLFYKFFNSY